MSWESVRADRISELEGLLRHMEMRLARLSRVAARAPAPNGVEKVGDMVASALTDIADRFRGNFRGNARSAGRDVSALGDDAVKLGHDALRRAAREIEHRPFVTLAVAVGVGVIAAGLLARRG